MPRISGWPDEKLKHAEYIALYPNTLLGLQADHFFSVIVMPQAADRSLEKVHVAYVGDGATEERYAACRQAVGKLSGVKAPMPPDGSRLYWGSVPANRPWQWASADTHRCAKSSPTMNSLDAGP